VSAFPRSGLEKSLAQSFPKIPRNGFGFARAVSASSVLSQKRYTDHSKPDAMLCAMLKRT
jgi:hypothetical protein